MIKAIVFDMGGVLLDLDISGCVEAFKSIGFDKAGEMIDACHQQGLFADLESGKLSAREFIDAAKKYCRPGTTDEEFISCHLKIVTGIAPYKAEYLKKLRKRYPLFILSNNNPLSLPECARYFREAGIPFEETFKELFFSSEMKLMKPYPEIYRETLRHIGYAAEELLFIDDSPSNVATGREMGMNALLSTPGDNLEELIENALGS